MPRGPVRISENRLRLRPPTMLSEAPRLDFMAPWNRDDLVPLGFSSNEMAIGVTPYLTDRLIHFTPGTLAHLVVLAADFSFCRMRQRSPSLSPA